MNVHAFLLYWLYIPRFSPSAEFCVVHWWVMIMMDPPPYHIQCQCIVVILLYISEWRDAQSIVWHFRVWETCRNDRKVGKSCWSCTLWRLSCWPCGCTGWWCQARHTAKGTEPWCLLSLSDGAGSLALSLLTMDTFVLRLIYPCPFVLMRDLTNTSYLQRWSNISEKLLLLWFWAANYLILYIPFPFSLLTILGPYILQLFWFWPWSSELKNSCENRWFL